MELPDGVQATVQSPSGTNTVVLAPNNPGVTYLQQRVVRHDRILLQDARSIIHQSRVNALLRQALLQGCHDYGFCRSPLPFREQFLCPCGSGFNTGLQPLRNIPVRMFDAVPSMLQLCRVERLRQRITGRLPIRGAVPIGRQIKPVQLIAIHSC